MKRFLLTLIAFTVIMPSLVSAGTEPSPFNDFIPEAKKLQAINYQLLSVDRRLDRTLTRLMKDSSSYRQRIGTVISLIAINRKIERLDKRLTSLAADVTASCSAGSDCSADDVQALIDALLRIETSVSVIIDGVLDFLDGPAGEDIPESIISAVSQVLGTFQIFAEKAHHIFSLFDFPDITTYCHGEFNRIIIETRGDSSSYRVVFPVLDPNPQPASGTRSGDNLTLNAAVQGMDLSYEFAFLNNDENISGQIIIDAGGQTYIWNEWGVNGNCPTDDSVTNGAPRFIGNNFTNIAYIEDISLFRSAAGHDYSDDFETCRSMKHYFSPFLEERQNGNIPIYSPVNGTIANLYTEEENFADDGITNQRVVIRPDNQPAILIVLFHVDLLSPSTVAGSTVSAGEQLGYARMVANGGQPSHDFDIALHANTNNGIRYLSYFDAMTDTLFSGYAAWGGGAVRDDFIISEAQRAADPLICSGETITFYGSLPSWYSDWP